MQKGHGEIPQRHQHRGGNPNPFLSADRALDQEQTDRADKEGGREIAVHVEILDVDDVFFKAHMDPAHARDRVSHQRGGDAQNGPDRHDGRELDGHELKQQLSRLRPEIRDACECGGEDCKPAHKVALPEHGEAAEEQAGQSDPDQVPQQHAKGEAFLLKERAEQHKGDAEVPDRAEIHKASPPGRCGDLLPVDEIHRKKQGYVKCGCWKNVIHVCLNQMSPFPAGAGVIHDCPPAFVSRGIPAY